MTQKLPHSDQNTKKKIEDGEHKLFLPKTDSIFSGISYSYNNNNNITIIMITIITECSEYPLNILMFSLVFQIFLNTLQ